MWSFPHTPTLEMNFYRKATSTQGLVAQQTGRAVPANAPLEATFALGNTDTVRKRITVILHDADWSDQITCSFWLNAGQVMHPYAVRGHTNEAWTNTEIAFYAATANATGSTGAYRLDNVRLRYAPEQSATRTECEDPHRTPPAGTTSGNLLGNSSFSNATLPPWGTWGALTWQLTNGIFEFFRPAGDPAGVVLQGTNEAVVTRQHYVADFRLGNTSSVRQRVTVLIQDMNFTDQTTCSFWLPAGMPLSPFRITGFASIGYTNLGVSFYPANIGTAPTYQWLQLDDVTLQKTLADTAGTECIEPGELVPVNATVTLDLTGTGTGSVTSNPAGLSCSGAAQSCTGTFTAGTLVTLTAEPTTGDVFRGWGGVPACAASSAAVCTFTAEEGAYVSARFDAPPTYDVSYYHTDVLGSVRAITGAAHGRQERPDG